MQQTHKMLSLLRGLAMGIALLALPTAALAADGFARSSGTLRAGAGSDYPAVMRVHAGTGLDVVGCIRRYTWCDVAVDGERGWFPGRRIGFLRDGRRVYLSDGGATFGLTILSFGMADYWGSHYSQRPWYNERRWWRGHGPMPPHVRARGPHAKSIDRVTPRMRPAEPPRVRAKPPAASPIHRKPSGVVHAKPPRHVGRTDRLRRPHPVQRRAPQGKGQRPMPPSGR